MTPKPENQEWIGGRIPLPGRILEPTPHETELIVWLSVPEDLIVAGEVVDPFGSPVSFGEVLQQAMDAPMAGPPRRPRRVRVADEALAAEVRAVAPDVEIVVAPTPELDAVAELMAASLSGGDGLGYLEGGAVSVETVADLFAGADLLFATAPWERGTDEYLFRLDIPALGIEGACLATMGSEGESVGFSVFPSLERFLHFADTVGSMSDEDGEFVPPADDADVDFGSDQLVVSFVPADELPPAMRADAEELGCEVAGPEAYPWPQYRACDATPWPVGEVYMRALAATCRSLATFTLEHAHLFESDSFDPVCESYFDEDDFEVRLTMPYEAWSSFEVNEPPPAADILFRPEVRAMDDGNGVRNEPGVRSEDARPSKPRAGRNDPCPCGSGKKYKRCCLDSDRRAGHGGRQLLPAEAAASEGVLNRVLSWSEDAGAAAIDWDARRDEALAQHIGEALAGVGAEPADLPELIGDGLADAMFAWIMEDLMSRRLWDEQPGASMLDAFLARNEWRLSARDAAYLRALSESRPGLYDVRDARPGEGLTLADMVAGGDPVEVVERAGSRQLARGDCIATRLLHLDDRIVLAGGALPFPRATAERAIAGIEKAMKKTRRQLRKLHGLDAATDAQIDEILREHVIGIAAPLLSTTWLVDMLTKRE